jgi:hypothetical protein
LKSYLPTLVGREGEKLVDSRSKAGLSAPSLQYRSADSIAGRRPEQIWIDAKEAWLMNIASEDFGVPLDGSVIRPAYLATSSL